jgi:hypothetical protein
MKPLAGSQRRLCQLPVQRNQIRAQISRKPEIAGVVGCKTGVGCELHHFDRVHRHLVHTKPIPQAKGSDQSGQQVRIAPRFDHADIGQFEHQQFGEDQPHAGEPFGNVVSLRFSKQQGGESRRIDNLNGRRGLRE